MNNLQEELTKLAPVIAEKIKEVPYRSDVEDRSTSFSNGLPSVIYCVYSLLRNVFLLKIRQIRQAPDGVDPGNVSLLSATHASLLISSCGQKQYETVKVICSSFFGSSPEADELVPVVTEEQKKAARPWRHSGYAGYYGE